MTEEAVQTWAPARLSDVARVVRGRVLPAEKPTLPFVGMDGVEAHTMRLLGTVPASTVKSSAVHFRPGDVLYGRLRPYLNKVLAPDFEGLASAEFIPLTMPEGIAPKFIKYRVNAAVEGRLVPTEAELARAEGRSYEPASVLLERILAERRRRWEEAELVKMKAKGKVPQDDRWKTKYEEPVTPDTSDLPTLPEGWCWTTVEQLIKEPLANGRSVKTAESGFPVLRLTALREGAIDLAERKVGDWTAQEAAGYLVREGDFLVSRGNGSIRLVGVGGLVPMVSTPVAYPDTMIRFRLCEHIDPGFFASVWNSRAVRSQIERKAKTTAGIFKVSQPDLATCVIPLPPVEEQQRIRAEIDRRISMADAAAATARGTVARCARLRQSILKWAFEGRLVDQDPSDEPASVLLEHIRAEREAAQADRPTRRGAKAPKHRAAEASRPSARRSV